MQAEPSRQHPVESRGCPASLHVTQHRLPRLVTRPCLDLHLEHLTDATEAYVPERVDALVDQLHRAFLRCRTLGDDDDRRIVACEPLLDVATHGIDVERALRD